MGKDSAVEPGALEVRTGSSPSRSLGGPSGGTSLGVRGLLASFLWIGALAPGCTAFVLPDPPAPAREESARRVQDVEYALKVLQRIHPGLYTHAPPEAFESEVERVRGSAADGSAEETFLGLMRLVALARDAHTRVASWDPIADPALPILVESWSDGYWVSAVQPKWHACFARRVVAIEGLPIAEVAARLSPWLPHENSTQLRQHAASACSTPRLLRAAGVLAGSERVRIRLLDRDGTEEDVEIETVPRDSLAAPVFFAPGAPWKPPLFRERWLEDWWWRVLDDGSTLYLQYNRCVERGEHPFEETARECLARIDQGIERVVLDLRNNPGGDSRVLRPLIDGLAVRSDRLPGSRILVAIGPGTFSSGMLNAWQMKRDLGAVLIGEPTSQKPDAYGEVHTVTLPNTGWRLDCSTKHFTPFGDDRPALAPDVPVAYGFADVLDGCDPVIERILSSAPSTR